LKIARPIASSKSEWNDMVNMILPILQPRPARRIGTTALLGSEYSRDIIAAPATIRSKKPSAMLRSARPKFRRIGGVRGTILLAPFDLANACPIFSLLLHSTGNAGSRANVAAVVMSTLAGASAENYAGSFRFEERPLISQIVLGFSFLCMSYSFAFSACPRRSKALGYMPELAGAPGEIMKDARYYGISICGWKFAQDYPPTLMSAARAAVDFISEQSGREKDSRPSGEMKAGCQVGARVTAPCREETWPADELVIASGTPAEREAGDSTDAQPRADRKHTLTTAPPTDAGSSRASNHVDAPASSATRQQRVFPPIRLR
jgi:hypothetical protein